MSDQEIMILRTESTERLYDVASSGGVYRIYMAMFQWLDRQRFFGHDEPTKPEHPARPKDLDDPEAVRAYSRKLDGYARRLRGVETRSRYWPDVLQARQGDFHAARNAVRLLCEYDSEVSVKTSHVRTVGEEVPYWQTPPWQQATLSGNALVQILTDPTPIDVGLLRNDHDRLQRCKKGPLPDSHKNAPPLVNGKSHEHRAEILTAAVDRLLRDGFDNLAQQDSARRVLVIAGIEFDGKAMEQRRLVKYGSTQAVADARFDSRFPKGSKSRDALDEEGWQYEWGRLHQDTLKWLGEEDHE